MIRRLMVAWYRWKTQQNVRKMMRTGEYSTGPNMLFGEWSRKQRREWRKTTKRINKDPERYHTLEH